MRVFLAFAAVAILIMCTFAMLVSVEVPEGASVQLDVESYIVHAEPLAPCHADVDLSAAPHYPEHNGSLAAADLINESTCHTLGTIAIASPQESNRGHPAHADLEILREVAARMLHYRGTSGDIVNREAINRRSWKLGRLAARVGMRA